MVVLLSGNYRAKRDLATKILEGDNSFLIIDANELDRARKRNESLEGIVESQLIRKINTVIYDNDSLKNVCKNYNEVFHVNFEETERGLTVDFPELSTGLICDDLGRVAFVLKEFADIYIKANNRDSEIELN